MYREGFQGTLQMHRFGCDFYRPPRSNVRLLPKWLSNMQPHVTQWLRALPKPAGIFAPSPDYAATLLNICRNEDIAVPERIAVLSAVDDPPLCNVFTPPLSCVDLPAERIVYEAAAMLARSMAGRQAPEHTVWIPASHVVVRQSSDLVAIEDADMARAVRFIREHACRGIGVPEVVAQMGLSRRMLELKFQQYLGRTPKEEILKIRLERAQLLLSQSDMSIESIARKSGFPSFKHFASLFRREVGVTPRAFRKTNRIHRETPAKGP
jgi:LacI family transcriptional regulator